MVEEMLIIDESLTPERELLTIEEAVQYVRRQKGIEISPAALSRRITRGLEYERDESWHILISPTELDRIRFKPQYYIVEGTGRKVYFKDIHPVPVTSTNGLMRLAKKYGELVNEEELLKLLKKKKGHGYTKGAIKQRRERKAIYYVAYDPTKRGVYWYPVDQIDYLNWQPELGEAQRKAA